MKYTSLWTTNLCTIVFFCVMCKGTKKRVKYQIYLSIFEMQPIFASFWGKDKISFCNFQIILLIICRKRVHKENRPYCATHQHTNLSVVERCVYERSGEAGVILHISRRFGDFGNHHVGVALGHLWGDFLNLLMDDDGGMGQIFIGELLVLLALV